ncbi:MAG TPA: sigma-54 dependent transcriptional regulator, partial [Minicystis sp.]|nr:sigma-54 dependent transcriptional regulator [Minicystis sp.]
DDEHAARFGLRDLLEQRAYAVDVAGDGDEAIAAFSSRPHDVVLVDMRMPRMDGMQLLGELKHRAPDAPVVFVTAYPDPDLVVAAMRAGASDYLVKPVAGAAVAACIERVLERAGGAPSSWHRDAQPDAADRELIGSSPAIERIHRLAERVASARATVLLVGESGTGKGQLARALHAMSNRRHLPLVTLQCSALPDSLLESELFGHEKGAFTGADRRRIGRFEQAHKGTLFLDEVGDIPPITQVKLLRVLQDRRLERVGGNETIDVDVRLIAATNKDLEAEVRAGRFREDLYYRLKVVQIQVPPLRARASDALVLADHFLRRFARENGRQIEGFTAGAKAKLLRYAWPGNVRELQNAVERAVVLSDGASIDATDLPIDEPAHGHAPPRIPGCSLADIERFAILTTLAATGGSTAKAADILEVSVRTVQYRLHQYGIHPKSIRGPAVVGAHGRSSKPSSESDDEPTPELWDDVDDRDAG